MEQEKQTIEIKSKPRKRCPDCGALCDEAARDEDSIMFYCDECGCQFTKVNWSGKVD